MTNRCRACLQDTTDDADWHERCARALFSKSVPPVIDIEIAKLHTAALAMVGHTSLSGTQKKISVSLSADRHTLQVAAKGGRYILKPQTEAYPNLPENEHISMLLATLTDIEVAASALLSLKDGSPAFVTRRFDRKNDGAKIHQEDFCQLAEKDPKEKYDGSGELCVRLLRKFATEPPLEILKLYRLLLFAWWIGNGDLHLKNLSLIIDDAGIVKLSPAYDLLCTQLVIPDDPMALPILGKKDKIDRDDWMKFAAYCQLPERAATRVIRTQIEADSSAKEMIERSFLPEEMKSEYVKLIALRTDLLR